MTREEMGQARREIEMWRNCLTVTSTVEAVCDLAEQILDSLEDLHDECTEARRRRD